MIRSARILNSEFINRLTTTHTLSKTGMEELEQGGSSGSGGHAEKREVAYFDSDFEWPPDFAEAQLAAIPLVEDATGAGDTACWDSFYSLHSRRGDVYKPRRYLPLAFEELQQQQQRPGGPPMTLLEVGCGLGSSLAAILDCNPTIRCYACDVSPTALELLRAKISSHHMERVRAFCCDVAQEPDALQAAVGGAVIDLALLIFTLSAIDPRHHVAVLRHLRAVMRPGSLLCFRDYGLYDITQLRSRRRLGDCLFARQDGTLAFFFTPEHLQQVLADCGGFEVVEMKYACVCNVNRATGQAIQRVFLHAKARVVAPPT